MNEFYKSILNINNKDRSEEIIFNNKLNTKKI